MVEIQEVRVCFFDCRGLDLGYIGITGIIEIAGIVGIIAIAA